MNKKKPIYKPQALTHAQLVKLIEKRRQMEALLQASRAVQSTMPQRPKRFGGKLQNREEAVSQYFHDIIQNSSRTINKYITPTEEIRQLFNAFAQSATQLALGVINQ